MNITVLAFATASDIIGREPLSVELDDGADLDDLRRTLTSSHPELDSLWSRLAVAVDGRLTASSADRIELHDGAEVALLPPVSGGCPEPIGSRLCEYPLDTTAIAASIAHPSRGAVLIFEGRVRDHQRASSPEERAREVLSITYSAYPTLAEPALDHIVSELQASSEDLGVAIVHRIGEVAAGECSVVIAVASPHREAAYQASRDALERLKREVPIWKREHFRDGESVWREVEPLQSSAQTPLEGTS